MENSPWAQITLPGGSISRAQVGVQFTSVFFRILRQIFMSLLDRRVRYLTRTMLFQRIIRQVIYCVKRLVDPVLQ